MALFWQHFLFSKLCLVGHFHYRFGLERRWSLSIFCDDKYVYEKYLSFCFALAELTRDRRISIGGQIVAKQFCAAVNIVAKHSTTGCHDVDSIARRLRRNTPPSLGIKRSLYSNTTSRSVARSLCRNTPPPPAVAHTSYSNTMASRDPSTETPRRHPASRGHFIITPG